MKAVIHKKYGPPEVARLMDVPKPEPGPRQVLVKVHATTVNRTDSGMRSAEYFISRFWTGLFRPRYQTMGCEFAGVIEKVGTDVRAWKPGEKVFGYNDRQFGGHAEYLTIDEKDTFTTMPEKISFVQAAAITEGAHYALSDIRAAAIRPGDEVMVYGATGAIGSAAVQLLKYFGAKVTAVCNSVNVQLVKSLGADIVVDYETTDFTRTDVRYSLVFDAVGKSSFGVCKRILRENGLYISTELGKNGQNIFLAMLSRFHKGKRVLFPLPTINREDVEFLKRLVEEEKFMPVIDRNYPLEKIVEAYRYVESGKKTGNVVISISE